MHPPLESTPMLRIGLKKSAILSLAAISTVSAFLTGCERPVEKADKTVAADVKDAEESFTGTGAFGETTATVSPTSTSVTIEIPAAVKLARQVGNSGEFVLSGADKTGGQVLSKTVKYSAVNTTTGSVTIAPTGMAFMTGSVVRPASGYALKLLMQSMKETGASAGQKAIVDMAAGHAEVMEADLGLEQIDAAQNHLERLLGHVGDMAAQIQANNVAIGALEVKEPSKALAEIDKTATAAKTGELGVWYPSDAAPIPALAAIDKSIADLTAKKDALKARHGELEKQRGEALVQGEKLSAQSEQAKGKQALDLYTQAANLRKTAGLLSTQMQDNDAQVAAVDRELSVVQAQQGQLQAALTKFADENKQVSTGWDAEKKRIDEVVARTRTIVEGDTTTVPTPTSAPSELQVASFTAAGDEIAKVQTELDKLRADTKAHLAKADGYFAEAAKLNKGIVADYNKFLSNPNLKDSPVRQGWTWMVEIHNDANPTLARALVAQRLARLYADEVYYTSSRLAMDKVAQAVLAPADAKVKDVIDQAKLALPKTLDSGTLDADVTAAKTGAADAFKQCETYLADIIDHPVTNETGKGILEDATVAKMVEQYAHYAYANMIGDSKADDFKASAKTLASTLSTTENVSLPLPLPPEIAPTPPASLTSGGPTTTGGTQPSETQPASAPSTNPSTQESPATLPTTSPADATATPATTPAAPADGTTPPATPAAPATPPAAPDATPPAAPATPPAASPAAPDATPPAAPATPPPATPAPGTDSK